MGARKLTLLFSAGLSILAVVLALTQTLPMLILVNLMRGIKFRGVTGLLLMLLLLMCYTFRTPSKKKRLHSWL